MQEWLRGEGEELVVGFEELGGELVVAVVAVHSLQDLLVYPETHVRLLIAFAYPIWLDESIGIVGKQAAGFQTEVEVLGSC